jgi:hypothetical protein
MDENTPIVIIISTYNRGYDGRDLWIRMIADRTRTYDMVKSVGKAYRRPKLSTIIAIFAPW